MPQAVHRTPRMRPVGPAKTQFDVPVLPSVEPPAKLLPVQLLVPVLGSLSILVYGLVARTPILLVTGGIMALASLASPVVLHWSGRRAQRGRLARRRERYREQLGALDEAAAAARSRLASALGEAHPTPGEHADWLASNRLWERRLEDDDVLVVRLGTADLPTGFTVNRPASGSLEEPDAELAAEVDAFAMATGMVTAAPLCLDLADAGVVTIAGVRSRAVSLARAAVLELALTCAPDDLGLVVAVPPGDLSAWDWTKWLPHTASSIARVTDRRLVTGGDALERHLDELVTPRLRLLDDRTWAASREAFPRVLVVVDRFDPFTELGVSPALTRTLERGQEVGVSVVALVHDGSAAPTQTRVLVSVGADGDAVLRRLRDAASPVSFRPFEVGVPDAEQVARSLAPKRLVPDSMRSARTTSGRLADLLPRGLLTDPRVDGGGGHSAAEEALARPDLGPRDLLRVPFAVSADGIALQLDLKESAEGGHGPHGLVVGAVGSGKSELLRTVVAALAATHGPDDVELAFADFKGGLTFSLLHRIPHCSGMVTNLADDLSLVDRMKAALLGELERRQQLLRAAGEDVQKIGQYRALREHRPELPPMPFLVVVVDEFGELLEARPDVLDVLLSIGRTGRSLGVHLVLASQRLETGRVRGLDSYLGYRICLRTFTAEDSMAVLGTRAAADLPALPGHGYLRTADGVVRFLTATVSGRRESAEARRTVRTFAPGAGGVVDVPGGDPVDGWDRVAGWNLETAPDGGSDLAVVVRRACATGGGHERRRLWLPPLPGPGEQARLTLTDGRLWAEAPPAAPGLAIPIGLADLPRIRSQLPLRLDPAALDGHVLVVGAPQTGKSTVLAAYAVQAAQTYPGPLLQFHVLDLGGGTLAPLAELPNVASYVDGQDPDGVRRVILELQRIIEDRPRRLRRAGASGPAAWRAMVAAGAAEGPAHTVLLLDQLASFRDRFPDLDIVLGRLVTEGPSAGVHLAMTSTRWAELPAKRLEQVSTRIELRLNDPMESLHGRVRAAAVPQSLPGRGLAADGCLVQIACPDGAGVRSGPGPDLRAGVEGAARRAQERWPGVTAPPLRRLADLTAEDWSRARPEGTPVGRRSDDHGPLLGVDEADFRPVIAEPSGLALLAYGDTGSGRSRFLTRLLTDAADRPAGLRPEVYVLDYLGAMLDAYSATCSAGGTHGIGGVVVAAAYGPQETPDVLAALADELNRRQVAAAAARRATAPASAEAVRRPPVWLVVDDYELVHAVGRPGPVSELADFVPYAARLGLSMVVAQGANGSGARVDPLVRRILEGSPWHLQFCVESRTELLLRGTRGMPLPPGQALLARPGRPDRLLAVLPPVPAAPPTDGPGAADAADADPAVARPHIRLVS